MTEVCEVTLKWDGSLDFAFGGRSKDDVADSELVSDIEGATLDVGSGGTAKLLRFLRRVPDGVVFSAELDASGTMPEARPA